MTRQRIPGSVWALGMVSLFMDMSSELVHAVLPIYLTTALGLSVLAVGIIEGIAEATASIVKVVSGVVSDRFARRKPLALLGYGLAALTKPVFPLAEGASGIVTARFVDRVGKGIRGAPRDALVADVTPPALIDAAYGLRQSLDTVGAFLGPLLAIFFLWLWANDLRAVLWIATIPAFVAVALLVFGVSEPNLPRARDMPRALRQGVTFALPPALWALLALTALFSLARLPEAFLILRAYEAEIGLLWIPLVLIVMSAVYAASSYPAGLIGARFGRRAVLAASLVALAAAEATLAWGRGLTALWSGIGLFGLHMGLSQGGLSSAVADAAQADRRATAFGIFHFTTGAFQLIGGAAAGWIWHRYGSGAAYAVGALWAAFALGAIALMHWRAASQAP